MIRKIDIANPSIAEEILSIQLLAYKVEAELIGFYDIPPLHDTIHSLMISNETFFGYYDDTKLVGAISITYDANELVICRLIVNPSHFRKGIGKNLIKYVVRNFSYSNKISVSTGTKNFPAIQLYKSLGFHEVAKTEILPNIHISHFER